MLSVDKRVILLTILAGMRKSGSRYLLLFKWMMGYNPTAVMLSLSKSTNVTGQDTLTVIDNGQSCIQIGIVAEHGFHELRTETVVLKQQVIRFKENIGTVLFLLYLVWYPSTSLPWQR